MLVYLVVLDLIHEVLNSGIKIARVHLVVSLKGQLGLCERRVHDTIQTVTGTGTGVLGNIICIICLLCQGQHRLIRSLVAFNIRNERQPMFWPTIAEILNCLLQLGSQRVFCPSTKESVI